MDRSRTPEVAVLVSTYQRPHHLERCLLSIALQQDVPGGMEVVVTDDGSTDETHELVRKFAAVAGFPVLLTTHPHTTFQLARCRNEGVAASRAPYLIFLDGDCILPPDHVQVHLARRRTGVVNAGYCICLDERTSQGVTPDTIRTGEFTRWGSISERWKLWKLDTKSRFYQAIRHRLKPRLFGGNIGISREDYESVNGYDENFEGWGCEDDDLRIRLRRAGKQITSILRWTRTYHLWHPLGVTTPATWRRGNNVSYLTRPYRLTRCRNGLVKRSHEDLRLRVIGSDSAPAAIAELPTEIARCATQGDAEVEVLILPGPGAFTGRADCNILVMLEPSRTAAKQLARAHVVVTDHDLRTSARELYRLENLREVLRNVA